MDHIDIQVWVPPVSPDQLMNYPFGESSRTIRERVVAARERWWPRPEEKKGPRVLRIARTIKDLDGDKQLLDRHYIEAVSYLDWRIVPGLVPR